MSRKYKSLMQGKTKTSAGLPVFTTWIDMPPEDVERLIKTLQDTLAELGR